MSTQREILSCSNCGYSWTEMNFDTFVLRSGMTIFAGSGLDFDDCHEIDVLLCERSIGVGNHWSDTAAEIANDAFVEHHAWEVELEAMHRPLVLTIEEEGALRFNPLTILRAP